MASSAGQNLNLLKLTWSWSWLRSWTWRPGRFRPLLPPCAGAILSFVLSPIYALEKIVHSLRHKCNKHFYPNVGSGDANVIQQVSTSPDANGCSENDCSELSDDDLKELMTYIDGADGGPPWRLMMDRSTPTLSYQAWYRDPQIGPTQYRTRTIFKDLSPELIRDFFWDDEFRPKWDDMLIYFKTLHVCPKTGTMIVHWIRKLPLFCKDREYVIIRRIWESESTYYCVTKAKKNPSLPRYEKPKRVDSYYSSWYVKPVESSTTKGSEVILFHAEDLGIPKEIVKMGVRAGMWSIVKKMDVGVQAYNNARIPGSSSPSTYALSASVTTKILPSTMLVTIRDDDDEDEDDKDDNVFERAEEGERCGFYISKMKWLVIGGVLITCCLVIVKGRKNGVTRLLSI